MLSWNQKIDFWYFFVTVFDVKLNNIFWQLIFIVGDSLWRIVLNDLMSILCNVITNWNQQNISKQYNIFNLNYPHIFLYLFFLPIFFSLSSILIPPYNDFFTQEESVFLTRILLYGLPVNSVYRIFYCGRARIRN